jgi:hypothetical protein
MDDFERSTRKKFLLRQENRRKLLLQLTSDISKLAGRKIFDEEILTVEEIDVHLISLNGSDFDFNYLNVSFPSEQQNRLVNTMKTLMKELSAVNLFRLSKWSDVAVVRTRTDFILENVPKLLELDTNGFFIYDLTYENGLWVDVYQEYWQLEGKSELRDIYELRVFRHTWMKKVAVVL